MMLTDLGVTLWMRRRSGTTVRFQTAVCIYALHFLSFEVKHQKYAKADSMCTLANMGTEEVEGLALYLFKA